MLIYVPHGFHFILQKLHNLSKDNFEIVDCPDIISMGEHPTKAFRSKPNSSIAKGFEYLAKGKIDGFICSVGTGGTIAGTGSFLKKKARILSVFFSKK